ncbi:MAG: hypothetical protein A2V88_09205 [Elusimicrobia bacterium RBG_16_66_12]|nr:MAG: hypothetical protein A2V88_09205 [Elusimicrobia bacterium RBG_16_66_12]
MSVAAAYKALDYELKTYGFWPQDLIGVLILFILMHGVFNSIMLDAVTVGPIFYAAWRGRKRPPFYLRSLFLFVSTPPVFAVSARREVIRR